MPFRAFFFRWPGPQRHHLRLSWGRVRCPTALPTIALRSKCRERECPNRERCERYCRERGCRERGPFERTRCKQDQAEPDTSRFFQILPDSTRFLQILPDSSRFFKILQESLRFFKILVGRPRGAQASRARKELMTESGTSSQVDVMLRTALAEQLLEPDAIGNEGDAQQTWQV